MADKLEYFENSLIQHGKENNRVYLMKLGSGSVDNLINHIEFLVETNKYTKIFTKIPADRADVFLKRGYLQEASIPKFFNGTEDGLFLVKYFDETRKQADRKEIEAVITGSLKKLSRHLEPICEANRVERSHDFVLNYEIFRHDSKLSAQDDDRSLTLEELYYTNAEEIAKLYREVFPSYPFPIYEPDYILETMRENVIYFGAKKEGKIIALSSAEIDYNASNAEMTDFATHPNFRGKNLSLHLLQKMETKMQEIGIKTTYTIARSLSFGMNTTFARAGYEFGGTLINNTNISGSIESMNVWHKNLT